MTAEGGQDHLGGQKWPTLTDAGGWPPPHGVLPAPPHISALKVRTLGSREMPRTASDHGGTTPGISLSLEPGQSKVRSACLFPGKWAQRMRGSAFSRHNP